MQLAASRACEPNWQLHGNGRFALPHWARLQDEAGTAAAWRAAVQALGLPGAAAACRGAFSVAMQDDTGASLLAVDRFAVHSLCYRVVQGQLRWAARADDAALGGSTVDAQALLDYLFFHTIPSPRTIFQQVCRLPPGHCARFAHGKLVVEPYWQPRFATPGPVRFADLRAEFLALLRQGVERQLDGSPPACFLSGGTDSSTVAGLIGQISGQPASTYSIGFAVDGYDELAYAGLAARHFGTRHHPLYLTPDALLHSVERVAAGFDQPFGNSSALPAYHCAALAGAQGVQTLLAGDGGDELFGGNSRYAHQRLLGAWSLLPQALRHGMLEPLLGASATRGPGLLRKAASYVEQARVPLPERLNRYNLLLRLGPQEVLEPGFLQQVDLQSAPTAQQRVWQQGCGGSTLQRHLAFDWRYTLAENDLPKVCASTAQAGLQVGFPLIDTDLVDFALRLPSHYLLRGMELRWFFRQALRGFLPPAILAKKKHGFGMPFGIWVCQHAGLRRLAHTALADLGQRGIVRPAFLQRLLVELLPQQPAYYGEMVWLLLVLELWLRAHAPHYRAGR